MSIDEIIAAGVREFSEEYEAEEKDAGEVSKVMLLEMVEGAITIAAHRTLDEVEKSVVPAAAGVMSKAWGHGFNACRDRVMNGFGKLRGL
jgi:hypothetical protein